jgi:Domain of unknown function DUF29
MRNPVTDLYKSDYYAWLQDRALRDRRIEDVDWENLAEEIDGLSRSEKARHKEPYGSAHRASPQTSVCARNFSRI